MHFELTVEKIGVYQLHHRVQLAGGKLLRREELDRAPLGQCAWRREGWEGCYSVGITEYS